MIHWLRLHAPNVGGLGSVLNQGIDSHMPQLTTHGHKLEDQRSHTSDLSAQRHPTCPHPARLHAAKSHLWERSIFQHHKNPWFSKSFYGFHGLPGFASYLARNEVVLRVPTILFISVFHRQIHYALRLQGQLGRIYQYFKCIYSLLQHFHKCKR